MTRLAVTATVGIALALAVVSFAAAQGPDVQISQLNCTGDPEIVVLTNSGDAAQNLTGWQLRSDPVGGEPFNLSASLIAGATISIQSGPSAGGAFTWATEEVFRDNDPTDYVKLVDDTGATVHQVNCAGAVATPTATPEPSPAGEVPNGGGPPAPAADMLSPAMVLIGGSLAAAGLGAIALTRLRLRYSPVAVSPSSRSRSSAGQSARRVRGGLDRNPVYSTVSLVAVVLTAVMAVMAFRFLHRPQA